MHPSDMILFFITFIFVVIIITPSIASYMRGHDINTDFETRQ